MRGPPPGTPKTPGSGRKKGTPNKLTVQTREALWAYIAQSGDDANPFRRLVDLMRTTADEHIVVSCATVLADRLLPKLKATEHSGEITQHILTGDERRARIEAFLAQKELAMLTDAEEQELLTLLDAEAQSHGILTLHSCFPESGPYARHLYPRHLEFFRAGAGARERLFLARTASAKR